MASSQSNYCSCLYYSANALSRIMTKLSDEEFAKTGLSSSLAFLLMTINDQQGIQPKAISEKMLLTPSTVTRLIEKMEYRGLLQRKSVGRNTEVYSTETGLNMQATLKACWKNLYQRYSEILGKDNADKLTAEIYKSTQLLE